MKSITAPTLERPDESSEICHRNIGIQELLHSLPEPVVVHEIIDNQAPACPDFRVIHINAAFERISGLGADKAIGRSAIEIPLTSHISYLDIVAKGLPENRPVTPDGIRCFNGRKFNVKVYRTASRCLVTIFSDITKIIELEKEVEEAHKLRSIGVLAAGIAHDFNNILTGVLGNASLVKMYYQAEPKVSQILTDMETAAKRAKDLAKQLLTFSESNRTVATSPSMSELLNDTVSFISSGGTVTSNVTVPVDLWDCDIDPGQFYQIISNLIFNGIESMSKDGEIDIIGENVAISEYGTPHVDYIKISIVDHGTGIPPENITQVFQPYFTTKPNNVGLGLSISKAILNGYGGQIEICSTVEKGTTAIVLLPARKKKKQVPLERDSVESSVCKKGRILLMDDEKIIRDFATRTLVNIGFSVVSCCNGEEAHEVYKQALNTDKAFDCIVLDLTTGNGTGGVSTLNQLLETDPEVKAIVSSGYINHPVIRDFHEYGFKGALLKPYDLNTLIDELNKVLIEL